MRLVMTDGRWARVWVTAAAAGVVLTSFPAWAAPLRSGQTIVLHGTNPAVRPELAGVLEAEAFRPFAIRPHSGAPPILTGTVHDRVRRSGVTGTVIFERRLIDLDDGASGYEIIEIRVGGFAFLGAPGFIDTDVDFLTPGSPDSDPAAPDSATREAINDQWVNYVFETDPVGADQDSLFTVNLTNARGWSECCGLMTLLASDGQGPVLMRQIHVFDPVPEPSSMVVYTLGVAGLTLSSRNRPQPRKQSPPLEAAPGSPTYTHPD